MSADSRARIREVVAAIPRGTVATYGDVAAVAGVRSARLVGRVLAEDGHDLPWYRVLRADGTAAPRLAEQQLGLLRAEGVEPEGEIVPLAVYRWGADTHPHT